jgi:hypothetical protein
MKHLPGRGADLIRCRSGCRSGNSHAGRIDTDYGNPSCLNISKRKSLNRRKNRKVKTFNKYIITVLLVLAIVLVIADLVGKSDHFAPVSHICYGYLLGYLSTWFHIGRRSGFRKLSIFLDDSEN